MRRAQRVRNYGALRPFAPMPRQPAAAALAWNSALPAQICNAMSQRHSPVPTCRHLRARLPAGLYRRLELRLPSPLEPDLRNAAVLMLATVGSFATLSALLWLMGR